ncbi:MAG: hypothetical protein COU06_01210 [Candidatus Harrisonbacteria bacterium CG10_big_fil_rev_8_21_14_0_10_38_8]|uniref:DUF4129 domain-containing protein n=1 Tax=Candidatus Harrisonbacteria bacterium CG10_big_fil_rev_8_21_14_0_10_38_8 TaxID=1974582 RepID=A0A2M6WK89_9BACT|nr:MAG: hypothetical protein COU06_01210 [Candidatus Harrisonbacteria bacterium CG10_big_fil_rev_8_21_14_0_10_38_8]
MRKFLIIFLISFIFLGSALPALAIGEPQPVDLNVPLPDGSGGFSSSLSPEAYIIGAYKWGVGLAVLLAVASITFAGVQYILSAGNVTSKESALGRLKSSVLGLVLLLGSFLILRTINPDILNPVNLNVVESLTAESVSGARFSDLIDESGGEVTFTGTGPSNEAATKAYLAINNYPEEDVASEFKDIANAILEEAQEWGSGTDDGPDEVFGDFNGGNDASSDDFWEYIDDYLSESDGELKLLYRNTLIVASNKVISYFNTLPDSSKYLNTMAKYFNSFYGEHREVALELLTTDPFRALRDSE